MKHVGDVVFYGVHGICRVTDISERSFGGQNGLYYILKPVSSVASNTLFVPVSRPNLDTLLKPLLSKESLSDLIAAIPSMPSCWIEEDAVRKDSFLAVLKRADRYELASLLKTLYDVRRRYSQIGKKLHAADERAIAEAERILYDEIAFVFEIAKEEVLPFLSRTIPGFGDIEN